MAYLRDRRAFGNIGTRKFRGARFGDPLSPRGPQYTKEGLILDYSTDVGPFTIIDQSGQDNTATLYSGRGLTMDAVNDTVTYATGYGSASRTATLWGRFNTTSPVALLGSVSGSFIFTPTATGVWEELTSTATVEGDLAWDLGLDFDIGDLRVGTEHWTHNDWSNPAGNTSNGKTIVDSGPNGYHGVCTGCSGFTGEATIPQTADRNWNKYQWFNGVDSLIELDSSISLTVGEYIEATQYWKSGERLYLVEDIPAAVDFITINEAGTVAFRLDGAIYFHAMAATDNAINTVRLTRTAASSYTLSINGNNEVFATANATLNIRQFGGSNNIGLHYTGLLLSVSHNATGHWTNVGGWQDTIGGNNGTALGTVENQLVSASDANDQIDALGNAILEPRRNTQQLNLFGEGEYSSTPDSDSLDVTTAATWEIWGNFYGPSVNNFDGIFAKYFAATGGRSWAITKKSGTAADVVRMYFGDSTGAAPSFLEFQVPDKVVHLLITFSLGTVKVYVDTVDTTVTGTAPSAIYVSEYPVTLGAYNNGNPLDRKIGSAKIYNRALTADEVLTNYDTQKSLYLNVFPFTLT